MKTINGTVKKLTNAQECPSVNEILLALNVLRNHQVAIYQHLYADGLTQPGGGTFNLTRHESSKHLSMWIKIYNTRQPQYWFLVKEASDEVCQKARLILEHIKSGKSCTHPKACCPMAEITNCVCDVSFKCPLHDQTCHGSHD